MAKWMACAYRIAGAVGRDQEDMRIQWRGDDRWAIFNGASCLNRLGEWEYEPLPSSRTDEYLERNRYSLDEAMTVADAYLNNG